MFMMKSPPEVCPVCGAEVPRQARACPECGADEKSGWAEDAYPNHLNLPDDEFDYDEFAEREFGGTGEIRPRGLSLFWWIVAILILAAMIYWFWPK